jgi:oligopeptide transport system substrate-binding protein
VKLNSRSLSLAALLIAGLLAATPGCGSDRKRAGAVAGPVLRLAQVAEPTTLDPGRVMDGPTIELLMHVFDGLVQWNTENKLEGALAERWDVTEGGRVYTFHLRKGVKFHNGREVTAADFVYSLTRSLFPDQKEEAQVVGMSYLDDIVGVREYRAGEASTVKGIEAESEHILRLTIDAPKAYFLAKLTYPTAYAVCREAIEAEGGEVNRRSMIGTGPFKLTDYARGDRLVLDANADYFEGAPKLARIERRILLDQGTRHDKFEGGELDIADVTMAAYRADRENPKLAPLLKTFNRPSIYYLALNQTTFEPFQDRKVRQAFAHAIDKEQIVKTVHQGVPAVAHGIIPPGVPGHNPDFRGLVFSPKQAQQLLAEAGYPNGQGFPPLKLSFRASVEDIRNTATAIAADLQKNLNIQVELDETEWTTFLGRRAKGEMTCYFLRWAADYLDPQNFPSTMLRSGKPQNTIGYANAEFDRLCDQADLEQDPAKRFQLYQRAESLAVADAPWVPFYYQRDVELWNPKLRGVEDSAMGHLPHKRTFFAP